MMIRNQSKTAWGNILIPRGARKKWSTIPTAIMAQSNHVIGVRNFSKNCRFISHYHPWPKLTPRRSRKFKKGIENNLFPVEIYAVCPTGKLINFFPCLQPRLKCCLPA